MEYRIDRKSLLDTLSGWDAFLKRKVCLIACGGTALTLLGVKDSTKDIDLLVPQPGEYEYLVGILKDIGYRQATGSGWMRGEGFVFDLFKGNMVHTTELIESPLEKGNNTPVKELNHIYLGVLNYYDLLISKLFRSSSVDIEDCLGLVRAKRTDIDIQKLKGRFSRTASFDVLGQQALKNLEFFIKRLNKEGLYHGL
ncbi:MAG: hypothetical protein NTV07_01200 [Candidatus Omnitrophica bacterium]|nr:hypothetical protein [Candidatus Omnitrophota bacterium]